MACDPPPNAKQDAALASPTARPAPATTAAPKLVGTLLQKLTWIEAKEKLTADTVVVVPVGAASKEHGPHLRLENDLLIANYFRQRLLEREDVVVAPTVGYHHYPAFLEYPGSVSLRLETARDLIVDICRSLAGYGPRRFYVLNTGVSTEKALEPAAAELAKHGILLTFTRLGETRGDVIDKLRQQAGGSHADEIETSMMLYMAPSTVDMSKAVKDYDDSDRPGLSPRPDAGKTYSPTGIWGDPTLATRAKGKLIVDAMVDGMVEDIEALRNAKLP